MTWQFAALERTSEPPRRVATPPLSSIQRGVDRWTTLSGLLGDFPSTTPGPMPPRAGPSQPRGVGASQFAPRRSGRAADAARAVSSSNESGSESADEEGDGDASSDEGDEVVDAPRKRQKRGERRAEGSGKGGGGGAAEGERGAVDRARAAMGAAVRDAWTNRAEPPRLIIRHFSPAQNFDSKVAEVMKLALMMEQRKQPLRRDDINKKSA